MIKKLYENVQSLKKSNSKLWPYLYKINKLIVNLAYPLSQKGNNNIGTNKESDVIVSLTTYPARIKTVWVTIASLLNQTYKPAKVLLYLSKEQFKDGLEGLPRQLTCLEKRGLEIVLVNGDLKPHKKYFYALQEYSQYMVITADDDVFYPENHIERLVESSRKFPDAVICARSHRITFDENRKNEFAPYNTWKEVLTKEPDDLTMPIGCNGVLYKRDFFDDELFDVGKINEYALYTDDLWLKIMEMKKGVKAYNCIKEPLVYFNNIFSMKTGLWYTNASQTENRNDDVWKTLATDFHMYNRNITNERKMEG